MSSDATRYLVTAAENAARAAGADNTAAQQAKEAARAQLGRLTLKEPRRSNR